jgi:hypothetical protein
MATNPKMRVPRSEEPPAAQAWPQDMSADIKARRQAAQRLDRDPELMNVLSLMEEYTSKLRSALARSKRPIRPEPEHPEHHMSLVIFLMRSAAAAMGGFINNWLITLGVVLLLSVPARRLFPQDYANIREPMFLALTLALAFRGLDQVVQDLTEEKRTRSEIHTAARNLRNIVKLCSQWREHGASGVLLSPAERVELDVRQVEAESLLQQMDKPAPRP